MTAYASGWPADNRLEAWLEQLDEDPGQRILSERFGGDELLMLRVDGIDPEDAELRAWLSRQGERLGKLPAVLDVLDAFALPKVDESSDLSELSRRPLIEAVDLVSEGGERIDFILRVDAHAPADIRPELVAGVDAFRLESEARGLRVRGAGHPILAAALDAEAADVERIFAPLLVILAYIGTSYLLGSFTLALCAVVPAILASSGVRAGLRLVGIPSDMVLVVSGPLVFVLLLAASLHLVATFRRIRAEGVDGHEAARRALREKFGVGMLAAGTTAVGFGVFAMSGLRSVSTLGIAIAIGVLIAVPLMLVGLVPVLGAFSPKFHLSRVRGGRPWRRLALHSIRRRWALRGGLLALVVFGAIAPFGVRYETNSLHYFPSDHPMRDEFESMESEGAALSTIEVLARTTEQGGLPGERDTEPLDVRLGRLDDVAGIFGPDAVRREGREVAGFASMALLPSFLERTARLDSEHEWLRWTVRFQTLLTEPTKDLIDRVHATSTEWADEVGSEYYIAGSVPAMLEMQTTLIDTLASSLFLTLCVTSLLFLWVVRSRQEFLSVVLVHLVPVATVLISGRLLQIPLDGATVMVAAVVLGLAVDNTFHLMHAAGTGARSTRDRLRAFERVGEAAAISSMALVIGFLSLALAGFAPTARFGLLASLGAAGALVADLVFLPALWIRPREVRPSQVAAPVSGVSGETEAVTHRAD